VDRNDLRDQREPATTAAALGVLGGWHAQTSSPSPSDDVRATLAPAQASPAIE
jgi:hypothetical protein